MPLLIRFHDNPSAPADVRAQHMQDHLAFLQANSAEITAAGPLLTEAGAGDGGLWLLKSEDFQLAEELIRQDPFWPTGLRHSHQVLQWRQVFSG